MFIRETYINLIDKLVDAPVIKIMSGIRRAGKSTLLELIGEHLIAQRNVNKANIITRRYSSLDIPEGMTSRDMYADLSAAIESVRGKAYLFLDEIQEIQDWEKTVNGIFEKFDVDIYITGSNSKLLAGEISSYLSGRFVSVGVFPFSYSEFHAAQGGGKAEAARTFARYLERGGFPLVALGNFDERTSSQIVEGIFTTVVANDIARRHRIVSMDLFNRVVLFIVENLGKEFSANSIVKFLKSENRSLTVEVIYDFLKWLTEAFVIYRVRRYDITGKAVLKTQEKFYLADHSLKYCLFGHSPRSVAVILENIVYVELSHRGWTLFIGKIGGAEIDFVAERNGKRIYLQVCRNLPDDDTREIGNLLKIKDHWPKYVLTTNPADCGTVDGVKIMLIHDFLLKELLLIVMG